MSRVTQECEQESSACRVRGHYPLGHCFPAVSAIQTIDNSFPIHRALAPYNPLLRSLPPSELCRAQPLFNNLRGLPFVAHLRSNERSRVWALLFSLAATERITRAAFYQHEHNALTERNSYCFLFLRVLRCFTSPSSHRAGVTPRISANAEGFPHSDIFGSQATNRLPEAFRRLVASFFAVLGQGIHRALLLCLSYGDLYTTIIH